MSGGLDFPLSRTGPFDTPAEYARLVEQRVSEVTLRATGLTAWVVTGHERIRRLLADPRVSAERTHEGFPFFFTPPPQARTETSFIGHDRPRHTQGRSKVAAAFSRRQVERLRPMIERIVDEHIERLIRLGSPADLHREFSLSLPTTIICSYLGIPQDDHDFIIEHSNNLFGADSTTEQRYRAIVEVNAYVERLVVEREHRPTDDLTSHIIERHRLEGADPAAARPEIVNMVRMLLNGGHETTANMLSLGIAALLDAPDQLAWVLEDPGARFSIAAEELMRWASIGDLAVPRVALADIEIDGTVIPKGAGILCLLLTANRDPDVFEHADTLDVSRGNRRHLAFGHGAHLCVGAELARVEIDVALQSLFRRLPHLHLIRPLAELDCKEGAIVYGPRSLVVGWDDTTEGQR